MSIDLLLGKTKKSWGRGPGPEPAASPLPAVAGVAACGIWPLALGLGALAWATSRTGEPHVWTYSAVRAELARIRRVLDTLNDDMAQALRTKLITGREWGEWSGTRRSVDRFLASASPMWGSNVRVARDHEAGLEKWRAFLRRRGAPVTNPGPGTAVPWHRALLLPALAGGLATGIIVHHLYKKKT